MEKYFIVITVIGLLEPKTTPGNQNSVGTTCSFIQVTFNLPRQKFNSCKILFSLFPGLGVTQRAGLWDTEGAWGTRLRGARAQGQTGQDRLWTLHYSLIWEASRVGLSLFERQI